MEKFEKLKPVTFIRLDNGGEIELKKLYDELSSIRVAGYTSFNMADKADVGLYDLIKSRCVGGEICSEYKLENNIIRVYWDDNEELIDSIIKDVNDIVYG